MNELVSGVNIALERADLDTCPAFDANGSDAVEVNELVTAVNNTLVGCPMVPSPTPSNTAAPTNTATATATETLPVVTATATLTVTAGTATPTGTVEEATPTPTGDEVTPTATVTVTVGTSTPTGTVDEATATPTATATLTMTVGTATPTGTITEGTPTHTPTPLPTGTPTATGTSTSTPTATNTPIIDTVAGVSSVVGNVVTSIPNMIASIANAIRLGSDGADGSGAGVNPQSCQVTGMITVQGDLFSGLTVLLDDCEAMRSGGGSTVFDGTLMVRVGLNGVGMATVDVETTFKNALQEITLVTDADLTAAFTATMRDAQIGEPCSFDFGGEKVVGGLDMTFNGTLAAQLPGGAGGVTVTFQNTMADLTINTYGSDCVPTDYVMVLNGPAQMAGTVGGGAGGASGDPGISFDVLFEGFIVDGEVTGNTTSVDYSGKISAICFGGTAILSTPEPVEIILGQFCPEDGTIAIQGVGQILYDSGGVGIDNDSDGMPEQTYPSCLNSNLIMCIG